MKTAKLLSVFAAVMVFAVVARSAHGQNQLPRVLIIGDVVYQQPAGDAAKELKDTAEVVFAKLTPGEVRNTHTTLDQLDAILGEQSWDVIHFNLGLGDLVYRAPNMKAFRIMPYDAGGVRATSPAQYRQNLEALLTRLRTTRAKLIWASTTPIRHSSTHVFQMESEIEYNAIAANVMAANDIPVNDMYSFVKNLIDMDRPASHGADPFFFDRKPIHPPMVQSIRDALKQ